MGSIAEWKRRTFPRGIKRKLSRYANILFNRTTKKGFRNLIERLEIDRGAAICIHSRLSALGHIVGGPQTIVAAVQSAVRDSTIVMPTFPFVGPVREYLETNPIYDPEKSPSGSGLLTEIFRLAEGSVRSLHPSHPCAANGPEAIRLMTGTEKSETPFGDNSSYGRYCLQENAVQLLINTNNTSIVHRIQELVDMPCLFEPGFMEAKGIDKKGELRTYRLKAHTPVLPAFIAMPGDQGVEYLGYGEYCLYFPEYSRQRAHRKVSRNNIDFLIARHEQFLKDEVYRTVTRGDVEIIAIRVKPWFDRICADIIASIKKMPEAYTLENLSKAFSLGQLKRE